MISFYCSLNVSYLQSENELINDLNTVKRENKKKAQEKAAKAEKAVASMFGEVPAKPGNKSKIYG